MTEVIWTISDAKRHIKELEPLLNECGFKARIIASVAEKGWSDHDLDILLTTPDFFGHDFERIDDELGGAFYMYDGDPMGCYSYVTKDGRTVDLFFEEE